MPPAPPPLPKNPDPAWEAVRTHVLALVYLLPSIFVAFFARTFLEPRVNQIWREAGLSSSKVKWLMDAVEAAAPFLVLIASGFVAFVVAAEIGWHGWRRYRRAAVTVFMLLVHTTVLIWITAAAVCATLTGPVMVNNMAKKLKAKMEQPSGDSTQSPSR